MRTAGKPPKNDDWKKKYKEPAPPDTSSLPPLPEAWLWVTLEQIAALEPNAITDGPFGSNLKSSHYTTEGPRVIRLQNIGDGEFRDARSHITAEHFARLLKHRVYPCDLVIAVLGERPPRSCIIPEGIGDAIVKADCVRFKPNAHAATSRYLNLVLNSEPLRRRTADVVHGVGRPRLNVGDIKALAIPLPPLVEQNRIAVYAERLFTDIDAALAVSETSAMRTRSLRQAILRRAFQGKLVPQDPADEPASVLLERIRADRAMGNNNIKRSARPRRTMRNTKAGVAR
jgi:type I restriction enzyme S subunit